ncbi:MAG: hypothetical protein FJX75_24795 [Armatimonadetes bacterium]|nr:hypothetical protein [Armatimonadota bacterium]
MMNTDGIRRKPAGDSDLDRAVAWCEANPLQALERIPLDPATGKREGVHLRFLCLAHAEETPSLTVTTEGEKRGLVKCFGCDLHGWFGLWRAVRHLNGKPTRGEVVAFCRDMGQEVVEPEERVFRVTDEDGNLVAEHHRVGDGPGKKLWWVKDGSKGLKGTKATTLPLYGVRDLLSASSDTVAYVTEGEPKRDALAERGLVAVATYGSKVVPTNHVLRHLRRFRRVVCWADRDDPGREHMRQVAERIGPNAEVVEWADGPEGGDAVDWFAAGRTADELPDGLTLLDAEPTPAEVVETRPMLWTTAEELGAKIGSIEWAWNGWVPFGLLSLVAGATGDGKSAFALDLAARFIGGKSWPDGTANTVPPGAPVLVLDSEGAQAVWRDRIYAWGLPRDSILFPGDGFARIMLDDLAALAGVKDTILRRGVRFVVVDSLRSALPAGVDENSSSVAALLTPWTDMARDTGAALWVTHHFNRPRQGEARNTSLLDRVRGSTAIPALGRVVLTIDHPQPETREEDPTMRLSVAKSNLARIPKPLGFEVTETGLEWCEAPEPERRETATDRAADYLRDALQKKPAPPGELMDKRPANVSRDAIYGAKKRLRIVEVRDPDNWRRVTWALPERG